MLAENGFRETVIERFPFRFGAAPPAFPEDVYPTRGLLVHHGREPFFQSPQSSDNRPHTLSLLATGIPDASMVSSLAELNDHRSFLGPEIEM